MGELNWLPKSTQDSIARTTKDIQGALGEHLEAVLLVGSAVHPERHDRARLPEILVVAHEIPMEDLRRLASRLHRDMKSGMRVRVITHDELLSSADVFTVEAAEYKSQHVLLAGSNPFEGITWSPANLRRSVEQGLRGLGRRVRNRVLTGLATGGQRDDPQVAVAQAIDRFVIVARYALEVLGEVAPLDERKVIDAVEAKTGGDGDTLNALLERVRKGGALADPVAAVDVLLGLVAPLIAEVDKQ